MSLYLLCPTTVVSTRTWSVVAPPAAVDRSATEIEHLKSTCADGLRRVLREHGRIVGEQSHDDA